MSLFVCAVDTTIAFTKSEYYLRFKNCEIKYVPRWEENKQDDLLLKMPKGMDKEKAYSLITELLSSLSFSWNAGFYTEGGFIRKIGNYFDWENIRNSAFKNRQISAWQRQDDFISIYPLQNEEEITLTRLYRIAKTSRDVYSQVLFFWHCLGYPNTVDSATETLIEKYVADNDNMRADIDQVLNNPILYNVNNKYNKKPLTFGWYVLQCVRHSIAHIERRSDEAGKSLKLDSLEELDHLSKIKNILECFVRYRLGEGCYNIISRPYDSNYLTYFKPKK